MSRPTLDRWIREWRRGGFDALVPEPRRLSPRMAVELLELAVALRKEVPRRTAAQVAAVLAEKTGTRLNERTIQRHFAQLGLERGGSPPCLRPLRGARPNERWIGDVLVRPFVPHPAECVADMLSARVPNAYPAPCRCSEGTAADMT